ncbi:PPE family protein [Mycobacterium bourgelatii]|uniref:PPE domain-containing protein n=1 Tax=Mycobacterium bourgelatii TaxID=1273442 RepID=A0A7I9YK59_MYCBU|nr:PPE family protein [Mycobacterium bourgelatii]MCV6974590.1 PPE family protein [Mycobacterium bourgelatii]GFG89057.1 hypothetical protein MBOU_10990 [Mycobacterium bourgelatii]
MSFLALPPEINSALMHAGAGTAPLLEAATAWKGLSAELATAADSFASVTSSLVGGPWQGASATAMAEAAAPYTSWLSAAAASAESTATQALGVVSAFETALAATVDPLVIAANRSELVSLALSNIFGQNSPAIAAVEWDYELMWAKDVAAMAGYHVDVSLLVSKLQEFARPALAGLGGLGAVSGSVGSIATAGQHLGSPLAALTGVTGLRVDSQIGIGGHLPGVGSFGWSSTGGPLAFPTLGSNLSVAGTGLLRSWLTQWGFNAPSSATGGAASVAGVDLDGFINSFIRSVNPGADLDLFPITLPLDLNVAGGIGPINIQPIQILPTIPLNFNHTFYLGPVTVPDIHVPAIPLAGISIPIDIGPLNMSPITVFPGAVIPNEIIPIPAFNIVPTGPIQIFNFLFGTGVLEVNLGVNATTAQVGLSIPPITLFPSGLNIPDNPIHLDVGASAGTGGFTIPGFSLPEQAIPVTINIAGQIDGLSTPAITIDAIPSQLHLAVTADRVVPIFPLPTIPLHIDLNGSLGALNVAPISMPATHVAITNASVTVGSFTLPQMSVPHIPLHVSGTVALAENSITHFTLLDPLDIHAQLALGQITGPSVHIERMLRPLADAAYVVISDVTANLEITPLGFESISLKTFEFALPDISIPSQNLLSLDLAGGIDPVTFFSGGLTFPENSVSLTNFSAGLNPFTIFSDGFKVDQFPFKFHAEVLSPTPYSTGSVGPIHIPAAPALPAIHGGVTGNVGLNLGLPSIPLPAIHGGLHGNTNYGFFTDQPIDILPFRGTGNLAISQINAAIKVSSFPLDLVVPVIGLRIAGEVAPFSLSQAIPSMVAPIDFTTGPITVPPLSLTGSIPLELPFDVLSAITVPGITHSQSIPLDFAFDTPALSIPETTIAAISFGGNMANSAGGGWTALLNAFADNVVNAGPRLSTALDAGVDWLGHQLSNAGLGNAGVYNLGSGNLGDFNFGGGNVGSYNLGWGNIGVANIGLGNSALGTLMGQNFGFGNSGSGNIGFGNTGNGNIGIGNTGNGNSGIGLIGDNRSGFGGWNSGSGNVGLFNSGTGNWGLFNSGINNSGFGNSGESNTGLFNAGLANTGVGNAGAYNRGGFNAGVLNTGAFNPGNANTGWFNSGHANTGIANSGNSNIGVLISGNHSVGALFTGDFAGGAGINILDINENLGPIHIDPIHVPGLPIDINETFYIGPFTIPQIDVPAIPLDIHQGLTLPAITLFEGLHLPAQVHTIPIEIPAGSASTLTLPVIKYTAQAHFGVLPPLNPQDFFIGQTSDPRSTSGQPTTGITFHFAESSGRTGHITLNLPEINIPKIATSPVPLSIDVTGGIPAFSLFPGGLSIPENPIPVNLSVTGGLQPFTIFPDGYTIDPIPLHLRLDANLLNPFDGIPPSLNLVDFHVYGGLGPVAIPDLPIPAIPLSLTANLSHGDFTIPQLQLPNIPVQISGNIGLGPIGIESQPIAAIWGDPLATIHFDASQSAGMRIDPFYVWSPSNSLWDPATTGPSFIAFGTDWQGAPFPLPHGPLIIGGASSGPWSATISGGMLAFNTPAVMIDQIPLGFQVPGGFDGATIFPGGLTFPANNLLNLDLAAGTQAFTIPARTIQAISADLHAIVSIATPDNPWPPYNLLKVNATGGVGPFVFPSFHIPSIPLGFELGGGIGPITIPSFSTPPISLGLDPFASLGPVTVHPISFDQIILQIDGIEVSAMTTGASTSSIQMRVSGLAGAIVDLGGTTAGSTTPPFGIPGFSVVTPPGGGIPGFGFPVDPITITLPLSVTIPSLTFPGVSIPHLPLGLGLSGGLPAFDLPSITIDRIPINLAGNLTLF